MLAFTMQIVKLELAAAAPDVVYASCKTDLDTFKLLSGSDQSLRGIFPDEVCDRLGDVELVGVGIGFLSLLELQDRPGAKFKVLLREICLSQRGMHTRA